MRGDEHSVKEINTSPKSTLKAAYISIKRNCFNVKQILKKERSNSFIHSFVCYEYSIINKKRPVAIGIMNKA